MNKTYEASAKTTGIVDKAFQSHPIRDDQASRFSTINERLYQITRFLCTLTPESAEQTLMIRAIQEAKAWAQEAIAKNE